MYMVHWGNSAPYSSESFSSWNDAARFIKGMLDLGHAIHSVEKS